MTEMAAPFPTKSDFAYTRVRELILSGELEPGAVINQATLAREIGISTTPLREALKRLKQQGLVELDAHRDARVARLDAEEARDLLEVRRSLDPLAAFLAADRRTKQDVAEMRAVLDGRCGGMLRERRGAIRGNSAEGESVLSGEERVLSVVAA